MECGVSSHGALQEPWGMGLHVSVFLLVFGWRRVGMIEKPSVVRPPISGPGEERGDSL